MKLSDIFILAFFGFFVGIIIVLMIVSMFRQSNRQLYGKYFETKHPYGSNPEFEEYARTNTGFKSIWTFLTLVSALLGLFGAFAEFSGFSLRDIFLDKTTPDKNKVKIELRQNINSDISWIKSELSDSTKTNGINNIDSVLLILSRIEKNVDSLQILNYQDDKGN